MDEVTMKISPRTKHEWLQLYFSVLQTLSVCMAAKQAYSTSENDDYRFPTAFYIIFAMALTALGIVSIRLTPAAPIPSLIGRITLIMLVIAWMSWAGRPIYHLRSLDCSPSPLRNFPSV